jgi:hypothetical protein
MDKPGKICRIARNMKSNPLISILMAILFINAAGSALLAYQYVRSVRKLQVLQRSNTLVKQEIALFNSLVNDTMEFSKKNPAILPVLNIIGIKAKTNAAPTPANPIGR